MVENSLSCTHSRQSQLYKLYIMLQLRTLLAQARPIISHCGQLTCSIRSECIHKKLSSSVTESNPSPTESTSSHTELHNPSPESALDASTEVKSMPSMRSQRHPHPVLDRVIRVNHAGERSAVMIYTGQLAVLSKQDTDRDTVKVIFFTCNQRIIILFI